MATLDKDLLNEWLSTMVRVFVASGLTPAAFAAAVVADVGDTTDAAAVSAALDAHIADAANAHAASAIGASGVVEAESGNWTTSNMPKHTVVPENSVLRFSKGSGYGSLGLVKTDESLYVYLSTADDASAARTQLFKINSDGLLTVAAIGNTVTLNYDNTGTNIAATTVGGALAELALRSNTVHATAAPTAAENTAAGYPNGALWTEVDAARLWVKVSESAGTAVWSYSALT